jgi:NAD(P)-dependent dehydrogenase (short-subunit alcohol dehydrogenase family)
MAGLTGGMQTMTEKLTGRRILITGAASGMGRGIARLFAAHGAALALLDRNGDGVAGVAAELSAQGFAGDVTDRAGVAEVVTSAAQALGGLDGIVNAAGILDITPFGQLDPASWDRMIAVNLTGPYNLIHAALPYLQAAERATIVNIASTSGLMPMAGTTGYSASKAGVLMFTRCLGFDLGPNIRANAICPGVIKTEMTRYLWENEEHTARAAERVALKRLGEVEDVARAALFFTTEDSSFTTGAWVPVDGGFAWH